MSNVKTYAGHIPAVSPFYVSGLHAPSLRKLVSFAIFRVDGAESGVVFGCGQFVLGVAPENYPAELARFTGASPSRPEMFRKPTEPIVPDGSVPAISAIFPRGAYIGDSAPTTARLLVNPTVPGFVDGSGSLVQAECVHGGHERIACRLLVTDGPADTARHCRIDARYMATLEKLGFNLLATEGCGDVDEPCLIVRRAAPEEPWTVFGLMAPMLR